MRRALSTYVDDAIVCQHISCGDFCVRLARGKHAGGSSILEGLPSEGLDGLTVLEHARNHCRVEHVVLEQVCKHGLEEISWSK